MRYCHVAKNELVQLWLCTLVLCVACKKSNDHDGPMPQPTKEAPVGFEFDTSKRITVVRDAGPANKGNDPQDLRPAISAERIKELKRSLPAIAESRIVEPLEPTPHSRLVRMSICMDLSVAETTGAILKGYKRKKWTDVTISTPSNNDNYRSFSANSVSWRLNGTTSQGEFENCKKSLKQSRVSLSFQERRPGSTLAPVTKKATPRIPTPKIPTPRIPTPRDATPKKPKNPTPKTLPDPGELRRKSMRMPPNPSKKDATKTELR